MYIAANLFSILYTKGFYMFYLMIQQRDDWNVLVSYRVGKPIKTLEKAKAVCKKRGFSFVLNQRNECVYVNGVEL